MKKILIILFALFSLTASGQFIVTVVGGGPGTQNSPPTVTDVSVSGTKTVGQTLTGTGTYADADGDAEGTSTYRWQRADDGSGTNAAVITDSTRISLVTANSEENKYVRFEYTPVAVTGSTPGTAVWSSWYGPITGVSSDVYVVSTTVRLGSTGVTIAEIDTSDVAALTDTVRFYITGSDQPTADTVLSASIDTSLQVGGGVVWDSIVLVSGQVYWYSGGVGKNISEVIYTTPNAPTTLTISSPDSDTLTYLVNAFSSPANGTVSDSCMVRWDTASIPTSVTDGYLVYLGDTSVAETDFFIDMADSLEVYVSAFAKNDSTLGTGTWSVAKTDSVFIDNTDAAGTLKTGLVSVWECNEASGNLVDAHASNDASTIAGVAYEQATVANLTYSIDFDGTDCYVDPGTTGLDNQVFSVSIWVKDGGTNDRFFHYHEAWNTNGWALKTDGDGNIDLQIESDIGGYVWAESSTVITGGAWFHIVGTYDGVGNAKLYINAGTPVSASNGSMNGGIDYSSAYFRWGSESGTNYEWSGNIEQPAVWSKVLTSDEISEIYNSGSGKAYSTW